MASLPEPLHTRLLTVGVAPGGAGVWQVEARVLDLRRRGVVALAGLVAGPGVVHDMHVRLAVGSEDLRIRAAALSMPAVPFPPHADTGGESCRDNEAGLGGLVGASLRERFFTTLHRTIGGPRGCFHVFTLLRLLGPSVVRAGEEGGPPFARTIVVDAFRDGAGLILVARATDLRCAGATPERVTDRFEGEIDVRVELPRFTVTRVRGGHGGGAAERRPWTGEGLEGLADLEGESLLRGYGLKASQVLPGAGPLAPMRELALMLQPVAFQCTPSLSEERVGMSRARRGGPVSAADSCFMWRRGGALLAEVEGRAGAH